MPGLSSTGRYFKVETQPPSLRAKRSNPEAAKGRLDGFVASAPRNGRRKRRSGPWSLIMAAPTDLSEVKALVFDVFGTVVDWRSSLIADFKKWSATRGIKADWTA